MFSVALRPDFHCMIQETVSIILPGWAASCAINDDRRVFLHYSDTRSEKATPRIDRSAVKLCLFSTAALELNHTSTNECICTPRTLPASGWDAKLYVYRGWDGSTIRRCGARLWRSVRRNRPAETTCSNFLIDTMSGTYRVGTRAVLKQHISRIRSVFRLLW